MDFIARHSIPTLACSLAMQMYGKIEFLDLAVVLKTINSSIIYLGQLHCIISLKVLLLLLLIANKLIMQITPRNEVCSISS